MEIQRVDRRTLQRPTAARIAARDALKWKTVYPLFSHEFKERGMQPLCRKCVHRCKVLDAPDSYFKCFFFEEKNGKKTS